MLPVTSDVRPRRGILFLGGRSFELEVAAVDAIGRRSLSIVERGQGLRRAILLVGFEVCWLVAKLRKASSDPGAHRFLGRLSGRRRSVAVWGRGEEEGGSSIQIVVTDGQRRSQLFFPMSAFGDGWGDLALVIEGFGLGDGWVKHPVGVQGLGHPCSTSLGVVGKVVHTALEGDWFKLLDRALVGHLRGVEAQGLSFATMSEWVHRWWQVSGQVEVRPLGAQAFLLVFSSRCDAESLLRRRWTIDGRDFLLEWWTPLALCASGMDSPSRPRVWIRVSGLPLHLRGEEVYRVIGDQCGGFIEEDESSVDLGTIRLCVKGLAKMSSSVKLQWGSWSFSLPVWVKVRPLVEHMAPSSGGKGSLDFGLQWRDLGRKNRGSAKIVGITDFKQRFGQPVNYPGPPVRVCPYTQVGSVLGSLGELPGFKLGNFEAHQTAGVSLGQQRWAPVHKQPQLGLVDGRHFLTDHECDVGPAVKQLAQTSPGQSNPPLTRVCASLRAGMEFRWPLSAMEASPESGRPRTTVAVDVDDSLTGFPVQLSPKLPNLRRDCAAFGDDLQLRQPLSVIAVSSEFGQLPAKAVVDDLGGSSHSISDEVSPNPILVADDPCLQALGCGADFDDDDGCWST
ncbi:hypothetical protein LOK49_LG09G00232 [Camellia lanceoleosa]|uniref:Uncharacterized protein n=1 Tax=Camellia lanceoleosa TaxID=1840588 RepID=A0ACC0GGW8_9ERIC|nr:hypothetical protein LOK49_LG09G00232 [Camellia lanceoleosa]